jgi:YwiC-like protein
MIDSAPNLRQAQRARNRALVVPREHGAWGMLLVPLFTGAAVGIASAHHVWPLVLFTVAALTLFWLRTPVESLLGTTPIKAQTPAERQYVLIVTISLAAVAAICLVALLWNGHYRQLLILGGVAALTFLAQAVVKRLGRKTRMTAQLAGAAGLTCTAAASYCVATGRLDQRAVELWAANWIFAGNQIHFVQLRIHAARVATFHEKLAQGRAFFMAQWLLLPFLAAASYRQLMPALVMLAFLPALVRGIYWFFRGPQALQIKNLGWSEMKQGILFGILLAGAFILSA